LEKDEMRRNVRIWQRRMAMKMTDVGVRMSKRGRYGVYMKRFVYPLFPEIETQLRHSVREGAIGNCGSALNDRNRH
jgi:hypothetical protein